MHLQRIVEGIGEAAFLVDEHWRVAQWNGAAEALLGSSEKEVQGRRCHEVLACRDAFGNTVCSAGCQASRMVRRHEPVHAFGVWLPSASGLLVHARMVIVPLAGFRVGGRFLLHVLLATPAGEERSQDSPIERDRIAASSRRGDAGRGEATVAPSILTRREIDVLRRLAGQKRTAEAAAELGVSVATVRTHVRNILRKLEAGNRLNAVVIGLRNGWI